jgi:hypothetical protein
LNAGSPAPGLEKVALALNPSKLGDAESLDALLRSGYWVDAAYVAERVSGARRVEVEGLHDWFSWADPEHNAILLRETHESLTVMTKHFFGPAGVAFALQITCGVSGSKFGC